MTQIAPIGVVETPEFIQAATKLMSERERSDLVDFLARNPAAGDLIPGTEACENCVGDWRGAASVEERGSYISITT